MPWAGAHEPGRGRGLLLRVRFTGGAPAREVPALSHLDDITAAGAEGIARMLAPLRPSVESLVDAPLSGPTSFAELLSIDDPAAGGLGQPYPLGEGPRPPAGPSWSSSCAAHAASGVLRE